LTSLITFDFSNPADIFQPSPCCSNCFQSINLHHILTLIISLHLWSFQCLLHINFPAKDLTHYKLMATFKILIT